MTRRKNISAGRMASAEELISKKLKYVLCVLIVAAQSLPLAAQGDDPIERARKNAREGLQAALQELQQTVGPDQRVTARSNILDANIPRPHLTGVWQSWEMDVTSDPLVPGDYSQGRKSKFLKWLVSHQDGESTKDMDFPRIDPIDPVVLLGQGTVGNDPQDAGDIVKGGKVPTSDPLGSLAWVVLDEGVKARINTPFRNDDGFGPGAKATMELGAGERPRTEFILPNLQQDWFEIDSGAFANLDEGLNAGDFVAKLDDSSPGITPQLKRLTHDVSYYSMGVFCNVARGGLKKDFHLMTGGGDLPSEFANQKVYATQLGLGSEPSAPYWRYLADFSNLRASSNAGAPFIDADVPDAYVPYDTNSGTSGNPNQAVVGQPQSGTLLLPTIARIQFIFGVSAEPIPYPLVGQATHRLNLTYMPVVTLHNPYNVALKFDELKIGFSNLPFAVQFTVNAVDKTSGLRPLDLMSRSLFELKIKTSSIGNGLLPGEVRIFSANLGNQKDTSTGLKQIDMVPGFESSRGNYLLEKLAPSSGYIDFNSSDMLGIRIAPRAYEPWSANRFVITMTLKDGRKAGVIEMDYQTPAGIEEAAGRRQNFFPLQLGDRSGNGIIAHTQFEGSWPFAEFSFRARPTSLSGAEFLGLRFSGKPWCFSHATSGVNRHRFNASHPSDHSHEFGLRGINNFLDANISINSSGRGYFISGNTAQYGVNFGALYDVSLAPIQSFSTLNGADPTGVSGFLPRVAQPIGNSWAHPLIASDKLKEPDPSGGANYLDHSFLLNLALYDHFYFSGLADQRNNPWFGSPLSPSELAGRFSSGLPLDDPRLLFYRPNGRRSADFVKLINEDPQRDAYRRVPAWQMMKGSFNVNSTSVMAWKAMLASIHDANAIFVNRMTMQMESLGEKSPGEARISRFRMPASKSYPDEGVSEAYWLGPREYSESELEVLAEAIVAQVRLRGPFLSMGDFVNRRLTIGNLEQARCGALQQAIDLSDINRASATIAEAGGNIPQSTIQDNPYYKFPAAAEGASYQGAPGCLSQADLLTVLGNAAAVRSDTFTIRAYGENRDESGQLLGTAWCEAVVQRVPDWLDAVDEADVSPSQLASETNKTLGRRFRLIAFRWLQPDEV